MVSPAKLPAVSGGGVRALWQGAPWSDLTFDGGTLLGVGETAGAQLAEVHAISAATGKPRWTVTMSKSLPTVLGLVPAGNVVVVEAGHSNENSVAGEPIATEYVALDIKTGRTRWTAPIGGAYQSPPAAVSGKYLLTGDTSDAVTGRIAATGAVAWRDPRPAACGPPFSAITPGVGLAADGSLAGASFFCGRRVFVWRLNPATGKVLWIWRSPSLAPGSAQYLKLTSAASDGGLLLLNGDIAPPSAGQQFTGALPNPHPWPTALGPVGEGAVLALAASDGHPMWSELGGQQEDFTLTDGAVCEMVQVGLECRGDATGAVTAPTLLNGRGQGATPPYAGDGFAGVSDGLAAVIQAPDRPSSVLFRVLRVRTGATVTQVRIAVSSHSYDGSNYQVFVVGAAPLGAHAILVLLRRIDVPGFPVLALAVTVPDGVG